MKEKLEQLYNKEINRLSIEAVKNIIRADNELYKYGFEDRVLIESQNTARSKVILSEEEWRYYGRGINDGAKSIEIGSSTTKEVYIDSETGEEIPSSILSVAEATLAEKMGIIEKRVAKAVETGVLLYMEEDTYIIRNISISDKKRDLEELCKAVKRAYKCSECNSKEDIENIILSKNNINKNLLEYFIDTYIGDEDIINIVDITEKELKQAYEVFKGIYDEVGEGTEHLIINEDNLEVASVMDKILNATYIKKKVNSSRKRVHRGDRK